MEIQTFHMVANAAKATPRPDSESPEVEFMGVNEHFVVFVA